MNRSFKIEIWQKIEICIKNQAPKLQKKKKPLDPMYFLFLTNLAPKLQPCAK